MLLFFVFIILLAIFSVYLYKKLSLSEGEKLRLKYKDLKRTYSELRRQIEEKEKNLALIEEEKVKEQACEEEGFKQTIEDEKLLSEDSTKQEKALFYFKKAIYYCQDGAKIDSVERSILCFKKLEKIDPEKKILLPIEWCDSLSNMGVSYCNLFLHLKEEKFVTKGIECFEKAMQILEISEKLPSVTYETHFRAICLLAYGKRLKGEDSISLLNTFFSKKRRSIDIFEEKKLQICLLLALAAEHYWNGNFSKSNEIYKR